jgi:integrase
MKYKASRDLPQFVIECKTLSPSKLAEVVLNKRNEKITPESITMWFKRHPSVHDALEKELIEELPDEKEEADASVFQNFAETPSVQAWISEMKAREVTARYAATQVRSLRLVCMGKFPRTGGRVTNERRRNYHIEFDLKAEGKWCPKHPDRLTLQDAIDIIALLKDRGVDTYPYERCLKDFLGSKGIIVGKKIVVGKSKSYGKLASLFVERCVIDEMLAWIKQQSFQCYVADDFMFKTGTRLTATLKALIENVIAYEHAIKVYDKARRSTYPEGKEWTKYIPLQLWKNLQQLIGKRKSGEIFHVSKRGLSGVNHEALKRFVPELEPKIKMPNHFWRHMFFQHMLRATDWNYAVCAELGGSTVASLQESYGKPPQAIIRQWGLRFMPTLEKKGVLPLPIIEQQH